MHSVNTYEIMMSLPHKGVSVALFSGEKDSSN